MPLPCTSTFRSGMRTSSTKPMRLAIGNVDELKIPASILFADMAAMRSASGPPGTSCQILVRIEFEMLGKDDRREVRRRAVAADADAFALQLFEPGNFRSGENGRVVIDFHAGDQHEIMARQRCLNNLADAHQRRITARQSLDRHLPAAQKNRLDVEAVFFENPLVLGHPDMTLAKTQRWIAEANFFQLLGTGNARPCQVKTDS